MTLEYVSYCFSKSPEMGDSVTHSHVSMFLLRADGSTCTSPSTGLLVDQIYAEHSTGLDPNSAVYSCIVSKETEDPN